MTRKLSEIDFIDLYLGSDYADFKGLEDSTVSPAGEEFREEIEKFRALCYSDFEERNKREFSFIVDDVLYRVATFFNPHVGRTFVLRQKKRQDRPLAQTGLSTQIVDVLTSKDLRGLVLVVGEMSAGKTSTISSSIMHRLNEFGGLALILEDPIETRISGKIGSGRAIQLDVTDSPTGYAEELYRGMRSNADMMMVGEVRESRTAIEVLRAGTNGHLVYSSFHSGEVVQGFERLRSLANSQTQDACALMSHGLALIIFQELQRTPKADKTGYTSRMKSETLQITGAKNENAIRAKIAKGDFNGLRDDIESQKNALRWASSDMTKGNAR